MLDLPTSIDLPSEIVAPLATAIGGIVLAWGMAEASLNMTIAAVFTSVGGQQHADNGEIPVAMKRKLKFIRRCFRQIGPLQPFKDEGLALFDRKVNLAKKRNDITHGFVSNFDATNAVFTFTALGSYKDEPLVTGQPKYAMHEIIQIGVDCMELSTDMVDFTKRIVDAFVP